MKLSSKQKEVILTGLVEIARRWRAIDLAVLVKIAKLYDFDLSFQTKDCGHRLHGFQALAEVSLSKPTGTTAPVEYLTILELPTKSFTKRRRKSKSKTIAHVHGLRESL